MSSYENYHLGKAFTFGGCTANRYNAPAAQQARGVELRLTMTTPKPIGTVQVDVDDLWVYYQSIGRNAPNEARALVYEQGIPRLLELFEAYGIRATFFIVGRDLPAQGASVRELIRRGHEVANHSTWHRPGFARAHPRGKARRYRYDPPADCRCRGPAARGLQVTRF